LSTLSLVRLQSGDADGAAVGEKEALQVFHAIRDRRGEAISLLHLGQIGAYTGDDAQARQRLEEGLVIAREIKHQEVEGECELLLGEVEFATGDFPEAERRFKRSLTVCREAADKRGESNALRWLGKSDLQRRDPASARARLEDALKAFKTFGMWDEVLGTLEDFVELTYLEGAADVAVRIAAASDKVRANLQLVRAPRVERRRQALLAELQQKIAGPSYDSNWDEGRACEIDDAVRIALSRQPQTAAA
jgi:tetratricopeptide (TPR) repeat protein